MGAAIRSVFSDPWAAVVYGSIVGVGLAYLISGVAVVLRAVMRRPRQ